MKEAQGSTVPVAASNGRHNHLVGWKAIGQYLGCTARTARRWEAVRALPVHRIPGGDRRMVWAAPEELRVWLEAQPANAEASALADPVTETGPKSANGAPLISLDGTAMTPLNLTVVTSLNGAAPPMTDSTGALTPKPPSAATDSSFRQPPVLVALACAACVIVASSFWKHADDSHRRVAVVQSTPYDDDAVARASYLDARFEWSTRTAASLAIAKTKFEALTERFPARAAAWSGLADTYLLLREFGSLPEEEAYARAEAAAQRALALDPNLADAWLDSAFIHFWWKNDAKTAFAEFATTLKLDPDSAKGYHWYATALQAHGDNVESLAAFARARLLDPGNRAIVADEGWAMFAAGHRSEGLAQLERLVAIDPGFVDAHEWLARCYLLAARDEDFLRESTAAATLRNQVDRLVQLAAAADRLRVAGRPAMLAQLTEDSAREWRDGKASAMIPAIYGALAGDRAGAMKWLKTAVATNDHDLIMALNFPTFADYRNEPSYQRVVAQLQLR